MRIALPSPLYGRKRDRLLHYYYSLISHGPEMRRLRNIDFRNVRRLVFVCKGNVCRSPYAEARARSLGIDARSCGLQCDDGAPANSSAIRCAALRHVDLGSHRSSRLEASRVCSSDLLVAMEPAQAILAKQRVIDSGAQVTLIGLWGNPLLPYLPDPYGLDHKAFHLCYQAIDACIEAMMNKLTSHHT